jgi:hypothetical protein
MSGRVSGLVERLELDGCASAKGVLPPVAAEVVSIQMNDRQPQFLSGLLAVSVEDVLLQQTRQRLQCADHLPLTEADMPPRQNTSSSHEPLIRRGKLRCSRSHISCDV